MAQRKSCGNPTSRKGRLPLVLIIKSKGRLGNQLFQFAFAKSIQNETEKLILVGFDELDNVFDIEEQGFRVAPPSRAKSFVLQFLGPKLLDWLADNGFISSVQVLQERLLSSHFRETTDWREKKGLLRNITLIRSGYFQSESFFNPATIKTLRIRAEPKREALDFMRDRAENATRIFVHVRIGDYSNFKVMGNSASLPLVYFVGQMEWFRERYANSIFIFLSDNPDWVKSHFINLPFRMVFSRNRAEVDFLIMTLCDAGILSPSSFSWWGGYLMESKGPILAPRHWLGFQSGLDFHSNPLPSRAKAIDVYPQCPIGAP